MMPNLTEKLCLNCNANKWESRQWNGNDLTRNLVCKCGVTLVMPCTPDCPYVWEIQDDGKMLIEKMPYSQGGWIFPMELMNNKNV